MHEGGDGCSDLVRVAFDVGIKQRFADDCQCESHHLLMDIEHVPVVPALLMPLRVVAHGLAIAEDALPVKRGLNEPALPQVEAALAGKQSVPEHAAGALHHASLAVMASLSYKHVLRHLRMKEKDDLPSDCVIGDQVSESAMQLLHIRERITPHPQQRR